MAIRPPARRLFRNSVGKRLCASLEPLEFLKNPPGASAECAIGDQKDQIPWLELRPKIGKPGLSQDARGHRGTL